MASYSDDFNRADGAIGASWTNVGAPDFTIVSNQAIVAGNSGSGRIVYASNADNNDHKTTVVTGSTLSSDDAGNLITRYRASPSDGVFAQWSAGSTMDIYSTVNGSTVQRGTRGGLTIVAGDTFSMEAVGNCYIARYNGVRHLCWFDAAGAIFGALIDSSHRTTRIDFNTGVAGTGHGYNSFAFEDSVPADGPYPVAAANAAITASRSPALTFSSDWVPAVNDVIVMFPSSTVTVVTVIDDASSGGWVNLLGSTVDVESDAHQLSGMYHLVTTAEAAAVTRTYTATNWTSATQTGNVCGAVIRGVDPQNVIDSANSTFSSTNTVTPSVLASLTGTNLFNESLVISCVCLDGTGTYTTPTTHTVLTTSNTNQGKWLGMRNAVTVASSDVTATNITPSAGDEYCSISVAFTSKSNLNVDRNLSVAVQRAGSY